MSDLFVILGIVAALLIGGVAIYNKIQERSYRRRSEEAFKQRHDDVLLGEESSMERDGRIEPQLTEVVTEPLIEFGAGEKQTPAPRELDRPWLTTLPEAPAEEPWDAQAANGKGQGMAVKSNAQESPADKARPGTLYEPRTTAPPGGSREPRAAAGRLYDRPPAANGTSQPGVRTSIPPGSLRESSVPPKAEPRSSIPPGSLKEPRSTVPPGSLRESSVPPKAEPRSSIPPGSLKEPRSTVPPGSLREPVPARERAQPRADRAREMLPAQQAQEFDPPHPSLDYVARIQLEKPLPASAFSLLVAQTRNLSKQVRFAGLNAASGHWEELRASATYKELSAGLQLADRSGPASDADVSRFSEMVRRAAASMKARALCPPLHQALASAIELDQFCADVDVTIGLNIIARRNQPFAASRLAALAEAIGFKLASNGNFEFHAEDGSLVFSLCDHEGAPFTGGRINGMSTHGVTLLLDVPRVAEGMPAFDTMVALANDLCEPLDGVLVDDNGKPLNERGIANIRTQLRDIYDKMQARQISAGSPRARRLFS